MDNREQEVPKFDFAYYKEKITQRLALQHFEKEISNQNAKKSNCQIFESEIKDENGNDIELKLKLYDNS